MVNYFFRVLMILMACGLTGCTAEEPPGAHPPFNRAAAERSVYEALIEVPPGGALAVSSPIEPLQDIPVLGDDLPRYAERLREEWPTFEPETWADLEAASVEAVPFPADLEVGGPVHLIDQATFDEFFGADGAGWEAFEARFGTRSISDFSRVGFNREGTQAVVYRSALCGPLCGSGEFVMLERVEGEWQVTGHSGVWIS